MNDRELLAKLEKELLDFNSSWKDDDIWLRKNTIVVGTVVQHCGSPVYVLKGLNLIPENAIFLCGQKMSEIEDCELKECLIRSGCKEFAPDLRRYKPATEYEYSLSRRINDLRIKINIGESS